MSHGDQVASVSADFVPLASTDTCPIAAVKHRGRALYGLQFHPEVTHTPGGKNDPCEFLDDCLRLPRHLEAGRFCGADNRRSPRTSRRSSRDLRALRRRRFGGRGGALLYKAIGPQLSCILVDNGLLRKDEEAVGHPRVHDALQNRPARRESGRPVSDGTRRRHRSAGKTPPSSATRSSSASATKRPRSTARSFSPRARSIPT